MGRRAKRLIFSGILVIFTGFIWAGCGGEGGKDGEGIKGACEEGSQGCRSLEECRAFVGTKCILVSTQDKESIGEEHSINLYLPLLN